MGADCSYPGKPQRTRRSRCSIGPGSRWTIGGQNPGETRRNPGQNPSGLNRSFGAICRESLARRVTLSLLAMQKVEGSSPFQPLRRTSCSYATDVAQGLLPGPFDDDDACRYARAFLIPEELLERPELDVDRAAAALGVPADQSPRSARRARRDAAPDAAEVIGRCGDAGGWVRATAMRRGRPTVVAYAARRRRITGGRAR